MDRITNIENFTKSEFKRLLNESDFKNCKQLYEYISEKNGDLTEIFGPETGRDKNISQRFFTTYLQDGSCMTVDVFLKDKRLKKFSNETDRNITITIKSNYKKGGFRVKYTPSFYNDDFLRMTIDDFRVCALYFSENNKKEVEAINADETIIEYMNRLYDFISQYIDLFSEITEKENIDKIVKASRKFITNRMIADFYYNTAFCEYTYINKALSRIGKRMDAEDIIALASKSLNSGKLFDAYKTIDGKTDGELSELYDEWSNVISMVKVNNASDEIIAKAYNEKVQKALKEIDEFVIETAKRYGLLKEDMKVFNMFQPVKVAPEYFIEGYVKE